MMFGFNDISMYKKSRFSFPAKYRNAFIEANENQIVIPKDPQYPALKVYLGTEWEQISKKLSSLQGLDPVVRNLQWTILGNASVCDFEPNGRIIVSLIINLLAGVSFSGFGLASFNIIYELCSDDDVIKFSALTNCLKGIGIFLGSLFAGLIVDSSYLLNFLKDFNFTTIQLSMLISIVLRFVSLYVDITSLTLLVNSPDVNEVKFGSYFTNARSSF